MDLRLSTELIIIIHPPYLHITPHTYTPVQVSSSD